jgi:hypothetical protein
MSTRITSGDSTPKGASLLHGTGKLPSPWLTQLLETLLYFSINTEFTLGDRCSQAAINEAETQQVFPRMILIPKPGTWAAQQVDCGIDESNLHTGVELRHGVLLVLPHSHPGFHECSVKRRCRKMPGPRRAFQEEGIDGPLKDRRRGRNELVGVAGETAAVYAIVNGATAR